MKDGKKVDHIESLNGRSSAEKRGRRRGARLKRTEKEEQNRRRHQYSKLSSSKKKDQEEASSYEKGKRWVQRGHRFPSVQEGRPAQRVKKGSFKKSENTNDLKCEGRAQGHRRHEKHNGQRQECNLFKAKISVSKHKLTLEMGIIGGPSNSWGRNLESGLDEKLLL